MTHTAHAIILAAGFGSRLQASEGHKLLARLGGRTLLDWHLEGFRKMGVTHITIVTGYRHEALEQAVHQACDDLALTVTTAYNPQYEGSNGLSVLAGIEHAKARFAPQSFPFWLTMADHIFDPAFFPTVHDRFKPSETTQGALFVDYKLDDIYDMPDATKVALDEHGKLQNISKALTDFQAVDVGLFWCDTGFVDALHQELDTRQDCSTSDAVKRLSARDQFEFVDIGSYLWQDVDTPGARAHAETLITEWQTLN